MARAEFSERHYELAVNLEMLRHSSDYFVPSQPEEKDAGYDIAVVPALPGAWSALVRGLPGVGSRTMPELAPATSLFLQYKRPDFIGNRNGKQSSRREARFGEHHRYYRIKLEKAQLEVLLDLQRRLSGRATVSYAAGCFHTRPDFYSHKFIGSVATNSLFLRLEEVERELLTMGYVPPTVGEDHCWTYDEHGGRGLLTSEDRPLEGNTWQRFVETLREVPSEQPLREHLDVVADTLRGWRREYVEPRRRRLPRWGDQRVEALYERPHRPPMTPVMEAHEALDQLGIGWFLAVRAIPRQS